MDKLSIRKVVCVRIGALCLLLLTNLLIETQAGYAQTNCNAVIDNLDAAINECSEINRNWVCYGSIQADAMPVKYRFFQTRDRRPFSVLEEINMLDPTGVVFMNLQFEDKIAPVVVVAFGNVNLKTDKEKHKTMTLGVSDTGELLCESTPSGMVVHTDTGETGLVTVNGVDIELASTAFITFQPGGIMEIANLEGHVTITIGGVSRSLEVGQQVQISITGGLPQFVGDPAPSAYGTSSVLNWLVSSGLIRVHNSNAVEAMACTGQLTYGDAISTQNSDPGQECLYQFCGKRGDVVTVDMKNFDGSLNPWLDLRGPGGWLVSYNDDLSRADNNSQICNRVLPLTSCDYTIIARTAHNETAGPFQLSLNRRTDCVQPELRCEVVKPSGTTLYDGPGTNFNEIGELTQRTQLQPIERTADGSWALVQVGDTQQTGWVNQVPDAVECEDDHDLPGPVDISTVTPTPTPTSPPPPPPPPITPAPTATADKLLPYPTP